MTLEVINDTRACCYGLIHDYFEEDDIIESDKIKWAMKYRYGVEVSMIDMVTRLKQRTQE